MRLLEVGERRGFGVESGDDFDEAPDGVGMAETEEGLRFCAFGRVVFTPIGLNSRVVGQSETEHYLPG
jgi:hypothetical protein